MRKWYLFLCVLGIWGISKAHAQQQREAESAKREGSYLSVAAKVGSGGLDYTLKSLGEKGSQSNKLGYGLEFSYSYYFNTHWGFSSGIGISRYASTGKLNGSITDGSYYNLGMLIDDDYEGRPTNFELRTRISNLEEKQTTLFFDIPVMLMYQTYFGEEEKWGMYGGLGVKLQFPFNTKFKIQNGENSQLNVSGYYAAIPVDMGAPSQPPVSQHGYGTITNPNALLDWNDDAKLKMGIAGTAQLGLLICLGEKTDLMLGGYIDYGFTNVKKKSNQGIFTAPNVYHPHADDHIGYGIHYNGMLNSDVTGTIKPIAFGVQVGLRFQMGK